MKGGRGGKALTLADIKKAKEAGKAKEEEKEKQQKLKEEEDERRRLAREAALAAAEEEEFEEESEEEEPPPQPSPTKGKGKAVRKPAAAAAAVATTVESSKDAVPDNKVRTTSGAIVVESKKPKRKPKPETPVAEVPAEVPPPAAAGSEDSKNTDLEDDWEQDACKELSTAAEDAASKTAAAAVVSSKKKREAESLDNGGGGYGTADSDGGLRSPILCIMGHVDTGKTKLLDKIRHTNVQLGEAGGITQQIGATFFPRESLLVQTEKVDKKLQLKVPGLLVIDTPGHASFSNLRKRGSSLCDMAILVVDIMHGLEPQTRESLGMLRLRKCPFVIALNKIDRLYGWNATEWSSMKDTLANQSRNTLDEFDTRVKSALLQLSEEGLNCDLYWKIKNVRRTVSVVPTSAHTGEGVPDLLAQLVRLTQDVMTKSVILDKENLECTILEVKTIEGLGTTIDVILAGGVLHEDDRIAVCGLSGPIDTYIRALLTPQPMRELRVKAEYIHHKKLTAAMGVKICAPGLEDAVAGTSLQVISGGKEAHPDEVQEMYTRACADMSNVFNSIDKQKDGCYVMASTLGSLEALLEFLKESKIPVSSVGIGTVSALDVKKASVAIDRNKPQFAVVLAFDVKISDEARDEAAKLGVKIMAADIIYHLFDSYTAFLKDYEEKQRDEKIKSVVFPCHLKILGQYIFNKKDPLVFGVVVVEGTLRIGTPLVVAEKQLLNIGKVESMEVKKKSVQVGKKGEEVCVKISGDPTITFGRHFDENDNLYSNINRNSIDIMKQYFVEDLTRDAKLVVTLKKILGIS